MDWTDRDQNNLDHSLRIHQGRTFASANEKWEAIARLVPGKSKKECAGRFKKIKQSIQQGSSNVKGTSNVQEDHQGPPPRASEQVRARAVESPPPPPPDQEPVNLWSVPDEQEPVDFWATPTADTTNEQDESSGVPEQTSEQVEASTFQVHERTRGNGWWTSSISIDPITQRPVHRMSFAPFRFKFDGKLDDFMYDGEILAQFIVSSGQFIDPMKKRPITSTQAKSLDAYLMQHVLKRAHVTKALDLKQSAEILADTGSTDNDKLDQVANSIVQVRDTATQVLNELTSSFQGLTPLLERCLRVSVGFAWEQTLVQLRSLSDANNARKASVALEQLELSQARAQALGVPATQRSSAPVHGASIIQDRLKQHRVVQPNRDHVDTQTRKVNPESIRHKAAQQNSKTDAPNFLLATAPHLSKRVQMATGSWGATSDSAGSAWGNSANQPSKKTQQKKKSKKKKKQLQGLAMKMK